MLSPRDLINMSEDTEKANLLAVGIFDILSPAVKEVDTKVNEVRYGSFYGLRFLHGHIHPTIRIDLHISYIFEVVYRASAITDR